MNIYMLFRSIFIFSVLYFIRSIAFKKRSFDRKSCLTHELCIHTVALILNLWHVTNVSAVQKRHTWACLVSVSRISLIENIREVAVGSGEDLCRIGRYALYYTFIVPYVQYNSYLLFFFISVDKLFEALVMSNRKRCDLFH